MSEVDLAAIPSLEPSTRAADESRAHRRGQPRRWRGRGRLGPRSLTAKLIVGVVSLVVVLVLAIGTGTIYALRSFLTGRLDQQVTTSAAQNAVFFDQCIDTAKPSGNGTATCSLRGPGVQQPEWVAAILPSGQVATFNFPSQHIYPLDFKKNDNATALATIIADPTAHVTVTLDGQKLRATGQSREDGLIVVTALSRSEVDRTLSRLLTLELLIGGGAVLVALLMTLYGVKFSLRRLRSVTATARDVAAEVSPTGAGLDRRVAVADDGSEVGQLAQSMNTLLSAVQMQFKERMESEARLRQFLADASHELRTPLTSIRGYAELARMQKAAGADAEDNLSRIESEGTRMSRLVEDLLMLARGEQPAEADPVRELVDVADLVEGAARDTKAAWPNRDVYAEAAPGLQLVGDYDQLLRAVRNLVANAAVHTATERPIVVRSAPDGDSVLIQVVDGGPGLPPDDAAKVFERFWRADKARTRARGGTGLGLSIVAAIVAAHGGTVRFDSAVETGSTVTIRLPAVEY